MIEARIDDGGILERRFQASGDGLKLDGLDSNMPLSKFIVQKNRGEPVVGDQIEWNGTIWTVAVMEGNKILKVGVRFPEGSSPGPGLFL